MPENELKPRFEDEFPDLEHPERNEIDTEFENGPGNATIAGYVNAPETAHTANNSPIPSATNDKPSHPEGPVYKTGHPIKVSNRVRTAGDANSGDPDLR